MKDIVDVLRRGRLRWFGHVGRREDDHVLSGASGMEEEGVRPAEGKTKKTR